MDTDIAAGQESDVLNAILLPLTDYIHSAGHEVNLLKPTCNKLFENCAHSFIILWYRGLIYKCHVYHFE